MADVSQQGNHPPGKIGMVVAVAPDGGGGGGSVAGTNSVGVTVGMMIGVTPKGVGDRKRVGLTGMPGIIGLGVG